MKFISEFIDTRAKRIFGAVSIILFLVGTSAAAYRYTHPFPQSAVQEVFDINKAMTQTVRIERGGGHGSGVLFGTDKIITVAHVVGSFGQVEVEFYDGEVIKATPVWKDADKDQAILQLERPYTKVEGVKIKCTRPELGEDLVAIGNPMGGKWVASWLKAASERNWIIDSGYVVQGGLVPGMSGGPVFDKNGKVVGMTKTLYMMAIGWSDFPAPFGNIADTVEVCRQLIPPPSQV